MASARALCAARRCSRRCAVDRGAAADGERDARVDRDQLGLLRGRRSIGRKADRRAGSPEKRRIAERSAAASSSSRCVPPELPEPACGNSPRSGLRAATRPKRRTRPRDSRIERARELEGERVPVRLGDDPVAHAFVEDAEVGRVEERAGVRVRQSLWAQLRQAGEISRPSESRSAKTMSTPSASIRRATKDSTCADDRSSHCASSTKRPTAASLGGAPGASGRRARSGSGRDASPRSRPKADWSLVEAVALRDRRAAARRADAAPRTAAPSPPRHPRRAARPPRRRARRRGAGAPSCRSPPRRVSRRLRSGLPAPPPVARRAARARSRDRAASNEHADQRVRTRDSHGRDGWPPATLQGDPRKPKEAHMAVQTRSAEKAEIRPFGFELARRRSTTSQAPRGDMARGDRRRRHRACSSRPCRSSCATGRPSTTSKVRGETQRAAAVHHGDRQPRHPLHPRQVAARERLAAHHARLAGLDRRDAERRRPAQRAGGGNAEDAFDVVVPSMPGYEVLGSRRRPAGTRSHRRGLDRADATPRIRQVRRTRRRLRGADHGCHGGEGPSGVARHSLQHATVPTLRRRSRQASSVRRPASVESVGG